MIGARSLPALPPLEALTVLTRDFYARPTVEVAEALLGKLLVRVGPHEHDEEVKGAAAAAGFAPTGQAPVSDAKPLLHRVARIVEVEAYLGQRDAASHARRGPTPRAAIMFGPPGYLYVYLVYGMHHCMNVVTESDGTAGAVLLRAAEPVVGVDGGRDVAPLAGPGKLCAGLKITRADNGTDLCGGGLEGASDLPGRAVFLADDGLRPKRVKRSPRIGVDYAGAWSRRLLRYYIPGNSHVSGQPRW